MLSKGVIIININSEWFKTYRIWATNKITKERKKITIYWVGDWDEVLEILQRRNVDSNTYDIKIKKRYIPDGDYKGRLAQVDKIKKEMMERVCE